MKYVSRLTASALLLATCALAQQPAQEIGTSEAAVTFTSGVNLVPVKVVVRDKQGRAVGDLKQSDFILTDKGKEQTISRYSVEKGEPLEVQVTAERVDAEGKPVFQPRPDRPVAIPERFIAYIFDDLTPTLQTSSAPRKPRPPRSPKSWTRPPASESSLPPAKARLNLQTTVKQSSPRYEASAASAPMNRAWIAHPSPTSGPTRYLNANDSEANAALVEYIIQCQGVSADIANQMARSLSIAKIAEGQRTSRMGLGIVQDLARRLAAMPGNRSIVYVSSGLHPGPATPLRSAARVRRRHQSESRRQRAGCSRRLQRDAADEPLRALRVSHRVTQRLQRDQAFLNANVMGEFANATGGTFVWNTNAYVEGFRRVAGAPEFTHLLQFSPSSLKSDGSFHELKIKLRERPGLNPKDFEVFARSGYYAPTPPPTRQRPSARKSAMPSSRATRSSKSLSR